MARSRIISPGFFQNETLGSLPFESRLCFAGLWTLADRLGRVEDRPRRIKASLFPYDDIDVEPMLVNLQTHGFIDRYEADGVKVIQVTKFSEYQRPHQREAESVLPPRLDLGTSLDTPRISQGVLDPVSVSVSVSRSGLGTKGTNGGNGSAKPADGRSKRPIFQGQRFVVFDWMLEDLCRMLGPHADTFDLHEWFFTLDANTTQVVPQRDGGKWLQDQTLAEAKRRGLLPTISETSKQNIENAHGAIARIQGRAN